LKKNRPAMQTKESRKIAARWRKMCGWNDDALVLCSAARLMHKHYGALADGVKGLNRHRFHKSAIIILIALDPFQAT
jgi:hypothetical protein